MRVGKVRLPNSWQEKAPPTPSGHGEAAGRRGGGGTGQQSTDRKRITKLLTQERNRERRWGEGEIF